MRGRVDPILLRGERPSVALGLLVAAASVGAATALLYPLEQLAPVVSLGVVYLLPVLVLSTFWGLRLGVLTALASAAAFNFFHLPPVGRFTIADSRNWAALAALLTVALAASSVAEVARWRRWSAAARPTSRRSSRACCSAAARCTTRSRSRRGASRRRSARRRPRSSRAPAGGRAPAVHP
jgi:two-component system sensor histidine kinase KdpD